MPDKPTQQLIPFPDVDVTSVVSPAAQTHDGPCEEVIAAFERLEAWLLDARGKPITELAGETLRAVEKALIEGKRGWVCVAEDGLEALKLRNGRTDGDDIPRGNAPGEDFQADMEAVLGLMHERMMGRGEERGAMK